MTNEERELRLASQIRDALGGGPASTADARRRVMDAVRSAHAAPAVSARAPRWRSPGFGLLVAASIVGIIAVVRARSISYVPEPVPGIDAPGMAARGTFSSSAAPPAARTIAAEAGAGVVRVQFVLVAPAAARVSVVGDFNDWDPAATPLEAVGGVWAREAVVAAGRHDYAFVVDGDRWIADPSAPRAPADEFGRGYSVLIAGAKP